MVVCFSFHYNFSDHVWNAEDGWMIVFWSGRTHWDRLQYGVHESALIGEWRERMRYYLHRMIVFPLIFILTVT